MRALEGVAMMAGVWSTFVLTQPYKYENIIKEQVYTVRKVEDDVPTALQESKERVKNALRPSVRPSVTTTHMCCGQQHEDWPSSPVA